MMSHTYRGPLLSESQNIKSIYRTSLVTAVHNHTPLRCIHTGNSKFKYSYCSGVAIDEEDAVLMHYRRNQTATSHVHRNSNCSVHDRIAWKYFKPLQKQVQTKLTQLFG